ncbi:MAG: MFS transporter, partial [Planctomycetes bacterium]|nr:MFS transporter [Planctomycetota bacterium]
TLGVATGAAVGGFIGPADPLLTLHTGSVLLLLAATTAAVLLPADTEPGDHPGMRQVLAAIRREAGVRIPLLLAFIDRFTVGFFTTGFPLMLASVHGVAAKEIGMLLGAFLFPFGLLSYPCGRLAERIPRRRLVAAGSLLYGLGTAGVGIVPPAGLWLLMPILGLGSAIMFVPTLLWLLDRAPGIGRSTAMASFHAAGSLGFLLGPLTCGTLLHLHGDSSTGYVTAFATAGLLEVVGAGLVIWSRAGREATRSGTA